MRLWSNRLQENLSLYLTLQKVQYYNQPEVQFPLTDMQSSAIRFEKAPVKFYNQNYPINEREILFDL